ncbi:glycosyltransferase [Microcoleus sp. Pol12B4]|uniref:glycosyltransferase n=1 Tax=Microcoleus sp. Pol12B4 TaxID=3055395 RepID=UPI002FCF5106
MKIVYTIVGLTTGGAEVMLYRILTRINRERFSPSVVCLMDRGTLGDRIEALGIPVYTIGMKPGAVPTPNVIGKVVNIIRQIKPDLIQGWMYHGNIAAQFAKVFGGLETPVFWSIHYSVYSLSAEKKMTQALIKLGAPISKFAKQVLYVSKISKKQHEALGYEAGNGYVIPNGIDTSLFTPSLEARLTVRQELGLPSTSFLIGSICRYHPMKDHANFIKAAALLLKNYPDTHFMMAGSEVDLANKTLNQLIEKLGIGDRIHLLGERSDMPRLMAALDIMTSASAYGEAFPLVLGEAMSSGVPCTVTDVGDSGWIVGNTGWVVPPKNPHTLAETWQEAIELGADGREKLGKAARSRIIECFSLESIVADYEKLYETAMTK